MYSHNEFFIMMYSWTSLAPPGECNFIIKLWGSSDNRDDASRPFRTESAIEMQKERRAHLEGEGV